MRPCASRTHSRQVLIVFAAVIALSPVAFAQAAQEDGGLSYDNRGQELLESVFVPAIAHAPFSLTLATEWSRPMSNGGTYTVVNSRPIKRDAEGRIYEERWLLAPKGTQIQSRMSWIQIADPLAKTLLECNARNHVCELEDWRFGGRSAAQPQNAKSGTLVNGRGTHEHEDLGPQFFAGLPVHAYRETTILNPGVLGNDRPMTTVREFRFSADLGFNLSSTLDTPQLGHQVFTTTEITTTEPDPKFFRTPEGYRIVDVRKPVALAQPLPSEKNL